jgi:hypothetical protein
METRIENEARLGTWPEELTVENVAAWILSHCNAYHPADAHPILYAMQEKHF